MTTQHDHFPTRCGSPLVPALAAWAVACAGCATMKMPEMPWLEKQVKESADSSVISSELAPEEQELGWDYFNGENVKKRLKKMVGRGPNEPVARTALAEADGLFREGRYRDAIPKYKQAIDRWPDSLIEEEAMWQLAECLFFTDQYPKAEDQYGSSSSANIGSPSTRSTTT